MTSVFFRCVRSVDYCGLSCVYSTVEVAVWTFVPPDKLIGLLIVDQMDELRIISFLISGNIDLYLEELKRELKKLGICGLQSVRSAKTVTVLAISFLFVRQVHMLTAQSVLKLEQLLDFQEDNSWFNI